MREYRAALIEDLPAGQPVLVELDGTRVALVRLGTVVHALADGCPHAGGPLSEGAVRDATLACPYHGWVWHLETGACLAPDRAVRVSVYRTRVELGEVWIELP